MLVSIMLATTIADATSDALNSMPVRTVSETIGSFLYEATRHGVGLIAIPAYHKIQDAVKHHQVSQVSRVRRGSTKIDGRESREASVPTPIEHWGDAQFKQALGESPAPVMSADGEHVVLPPVSMNMNDCDLILAALREYHDASRAGSYEGVRALELEHAISDRRMTWFTQE